jgi:cytochrome P450
MTSIVVSTHAQAREAFRSRDLRQSLYDAGHRLMSGVIVNLHGDDHIARRRLENRLFRRDTFAWYETEAIPRIIDSVLAPAIAAGSGELLDLARRTMTTLSVVVAGVDVPGTDPDTGVIDPEVLEGFHRLMERLARASTVAHAVGDPTPIIAAGDEAFAEFLERYFEPSRQRRQAMVDAVGRKELDPEIFPRDVLTTLLRHRDVLDITEDDLRREIAYFPWVGSHSTSGQLVHALHHMFTWIAEHSEDRIRLVTDDQLRQRFVHESMRLHPASPVGRRNATPPRRPPPPPRGRPPPPPPPTSFCVMAPPWLRVPRSRFMSNRPTGTPGCSGRTPMPSIRSARSNRVLRVGVSASAMVRIRVWVGNSPAVPNPMGPVSCICRAPCR